MAMPMEDTSKFPIHPREWTLGEVLALPEDKGQRIELVDGALFVSPSPAFEHQRVLQRLQMAFLNAAPPKYEPLPGINVLLNSRRLLIPDLAVTTVPGIKTVFCEAVDILLAVEIISPSSRAYDKALKRQLYAEAGVPFFVLVDPAAEPVSAIVYELDRGEYRELVRSQDGWLKLERPFPAEVDLVGPKA